ncbi:MAG TPA: dihydrolipoamide acetyltransferase family protein, partial [Chthoniobacterales bacterium]|nr:dihydrolipoamide acetyltransferase family protein [Chthoniobacterales bacterium]
MPEIQMPKLSDTMTEGTLVAWKKKKGDKVSAGEVIAEIETDKATMEWESPEDGTLTEIYVQEGGKVNVGDKIAFIGEEGEEAPKEKTEAPKKEEKPKEEKKSEKTEEKPKAEEKKETKPKAETEKPAPAKAKQKETAPPAKPAEATDEARVKASPVARRVAGELGVDLSSVTGTGPEGRVTESDVRAAAKSKTTVEAGVSSASKQPAQRRSGSDLPLQKRDGETRIQLSGMRKGIAERLVRSLGPVPHFYLTIEINAAPLMAAREELKSGGEQSDAAKITVNDFVLKGAVMAAVKIPRVNASFDGDAIVQYADVDLGIAVAIEDGLLTPVVRAAQNKSLREISEAVKDLAHRARNKRMKPEEFHGGSFTVSNLGGMGIDSFSAVINPPQSFILAVGKVNKVAVIDDCDQVVVGQRMSITMSCDHRVVDGALGAEY